MLETLERTHGWKFKPEDNLKKLSDALKQEVRDNYKMFIYESLGDTKQDFHGGTKHIDQKLPMVA